MEWSRYNLGRVLWTSWAKKMDFWDLTFFFQTPIPSLPGENRFATKWLGISYMLKNESSFGCYNKVPYYWWDVGGQEVLNFSLARIGHHKIMVHDFVLANIFGNNASASFILWTSQGLSPSLCRRVIFCANGWLNSPMWIGTGTLDQHPSLNSLLLPKAWHSLGRPGGPETSALRVLRGTPPHILQNWRFLGC